MKPGEARLRAALRRLHRPHPDPADPFSLKPSSAFEVALAEQMRALRADVDELKSRMNWLLGLIIGAAIANVLAALL